jgi:hypothetical protein
MIQESSKKIEMTCPVCKVSKELSIPASVFSQKKFGSVKVNIPKGAICSEHNFVAYLNPQGKLIGLEKIDLEMRNKKEESSEDLSTITLKSLMQIYGLYGLVSLVHAKLFSYRCFIIKDFKDLAASNELNEFFNKMLPDKFKDLSIEFIIKGEYERIKNEYKDALFINPEEKSLEIPWPEKIRFEENIVKKSLDIINEGEQVVLFKQEISNLFKDVNYIIDLLEQTEKITESQIINQHSKYFLKPKIKSNYFKVLLNLVNQRQGSYLISKIKGKTAKSLSKKGL